MALATAGAGAAVAVPAGIAAGAAVAGRAAPTDGGFHGGLVGVLWIAGAAVLEPLTPAATDVAADLARTLAVDVALLALGVLFGWAGGLARR